MQFTRIPEDTFQNIQLNAGIIATSFTPATGAFTGLMGATTGGINFNAAPSYSDYGDDIDNCPKNTKELKKLESWEVTLSGTFVTIDAAGAKRLIAAADYDDNDSTHIIPRNDIDPDTDFQDLWWIGDYSDKNTGENAGFCAVHLINGLNTGGFQIQSTDKGKGNFAFSFTGHYSMNAQDTVPFEVYIKGSSSSLQPRIELSSRVINMVKSTTTTLEAITMPEDAEVTWATADSSVVAVSAGADDHHETLTAGSSAGTTIITASIQPVEDGPIFTETCTVIVTAG